MQRYKIIKAPRKKIKEKKNKIRQKENYQGKKTENLESHSLIIW